MKLEELLEMMGECSNIRVTVDGDYVVAHCKDHIGDSYDGYDVVSLFPTTVGGVPYISIDVTPPYYVEIWHTPDYEDFAKVNVNKKTGRVEDIQTGGWDFCGDMTREEAERMCAEDGYTVFEPSEDIYPSYEAWDDEVSCGGVYEYL